MPTTRDLAAELWQSLKYEFDGDAVSVLEAALTAAEARGREEGAGLAYQRCISILEHASNFGNRPEAMIEAMKIDRKCFVPDNPQPSGERE